MQFGCCRVRRPHFGVSPLPKHTYLHIYIIQIYLLCYSKLHMAVQSQCLGHVNVSAVIFMCASMCVLLLQVSLLVIHIRFFLILLYLCCLFVIAYYIRSPKEAHHIAISRRVFPAVCRQLNTHTIIWRAIWGCFVFFFFCS